MHQLLHSVYITEPDSELSLSGQTLRVTWAEQSEQTIPLHNLESIISFSNKAATPALMDACAKHGIGLVFLNQSGRFRYRIVGPLHGNVLLRRQQYRIADVDTAYLPVAKAMLCGKVNSSIQLMTRFRRNHPANDCDEILTAELFLKEVGRDLLSAQYHAELLGLEGIAAKIYFTAFEKMVLSPYESFSFHGRSRRPPRDPCNALLSFAYTLLAGDCEQALECVGLDPYVGLMHRDRPGKPALALDLMEEFRPLLADRFVLRLINLQMIKPDMFEPIEDGGVHMDQEGRRIFLREWNKMKRHDIYLSELQKRVPQGLLPHLQAQRLARVFRGEDTDYHPVAWR